MPFKCKTGGSKLKDFVATIQTDANIQYEISKLCHEVEDYAKQFPTIGFEKETMKYSDWGLSFIREGKVIRCILNLLIVVWLFFIYGTSYHVYLAWYQEDEAFKPLPHLLQYDPLKLHKLLKGLKVKSKSMASFVWAFNMWSSNCNIIKIKGTLVLTIIFQMSILSRNITI